MKAHIILLVIVSFASLFSCRKDEKAVNLFNKPVYQYQDAETRWSSFENITAGKGIGASANKGAKGHACEPLNPGQSIPGIKNL